jgi:putative MATE family efflux protein
VTTTAATASPSVWSTLREAIRGSQQDFTEAPIGRSVVLLAVPMVLEMLMESVFAVVDIFFVANAINITLGPCLIFGLGPFPELGVPGAAVATTIGWGSGVLFQLYHFVRPGGRIVIRRRHLRMDPSVMQGILRISGTAMLQNFIGTASWMGLMRILTGFGSAAVAGNTIGIRIIVFALLPSFGVSNAAVTLVGQNLGAGKPERAEAAAWRAGWYNTVCLGAIGAVFLLLAPVLVGIFSQDPEVVPYGVRCLRIVAAGFLFYGYGMVLTMAFNGAGDTRTPTLINLACLWFWEIPLAWGSRIRLAWDRRAFSSPSV